MSISVECIAVLVFLKHLALLRMATHIDYRSLVRQVFTDCDRFIQLQRLQIIQLNSIN